MGSRVEAAVSRREGSEGSHLFEVLLHSRRCLLHRASIFPLWCCQDVAYHTLVPPYQDDGQLSILPSSVQILWHCPFVEWVEKPAWVGFAGTLGNPRSWRAFDRHYFTDCTSTVQYSSLCATLQGGRGEFGPAVSTLHNLQNPRHG
jgi:hypothetical protein